MASRSLIPHPFSYALMVLTCCLVFCFPSIGASQAAPQNQHWIGYVTDTHCGTHCQVTSTMKPDLKCVRLCVKKGSKYGLWSGSKVYELDPQSVAARFAAQEVRVTGTMHQTAGGARIVATKIIILPAPPSSRKQPSR